MRKVLFGVPGYMRWIPCPLSGMESPIAGAGETTKLISGRAHVGKSAATSKTYSVSWLGSPDDLQPIIDFASGMCGKGPFFYTDPMSFDNALSPIYAAPHLLAGVLHRKIDGVEVVAEAATSTLNLPPIRARITTYSTPNYGTPSECSVAVPDGMKAVVTYYGQPGVVQVATGTSAGVFTLAGVQPTAVSGGVLRAEYTAPFVSLHFDAPTPKYLLGMVVQVVPTSETVSDLNWRGGLGHTRVVFGPDGVSPTAYMAKMANGKGSLGLSGELIEV